MESSPGECDLYRARATCCALVALDDQFIEAPVREVIASVLDGCWQRPRRRPCLSLDLGANNGWMSAYMLMMGSFVVAVEPASDLALAASATAELNCWADRFEMVVGWACGDVEYETSAPKLPPDSTKWNMDSYCPSRFGSLPLHGHRAGGKPRNLTARLRTAFPVRLHELLFHRRPAAWPTARASARASPPHFDLIKLDGDGPERIWLRNLADLISARRISVDAIAVETLHFSGLRPEDMLQLQSGLGYHIHRIGDYDRPLPAGLEEERFGMRAIRRAFRLKRNLTLGEWTNVLSRDGQYLLSRSSL